jgi:hypothetical protein
MEILTGQLGLECREHNWAGHRGVRNITGIQSAIEDMDIKISCTCPNSFLWFFIGISSLSIIV